MMKTFSETNRLIAEVENLFIDNIDKKKKKVGLKNKLVRNFS